MPTTDFIYAFNGQTSSSLESSDSIDIEGHFYKDFQVSGLTAGKPVFLSMTSGSLDCYLQLIDTNTGAVIAENNDRDSSTTNSQLSFIPEANHAYIIRASSNIAQSIGEFSLRSTYQPEPRDTISALAGIAIGELDNSDNFDPGFPDSPYFCEDYLLTDLIEGRDVAVKMEAEFDAYLAIIDTATGSIITENDDIDGTTFNSQISFTPQPGRTYVARASSSKELETGRFRLIANSITPPSLPTLAITPSASNKAEGSDADGTSSTPFLFSISRTGDIFASSSVDWRVEASTQSAGSQASDTDFGFNSYPTGTITFEPGESSKTITVPIKADTFREANESFVITLFNPIGASIDTEAAFGIIVDDDTISAASNLEARDPITDRRTIIFKPGRGILNGSQGANRFELRSKDSFKRSSADVITNFNSEEGDQILFARSALAGVKGTSLRTATSKSKCPRPGEWCKSQVTSTPA